MMLKLLMALFTLTALAASGQTWADAERGDGVAPRELLPIAEIIFPECPTEDSNNCYRNDGTGHPFFTINDVTIIFD